MADPQWRCVHVFHHDPDRTDLMLRAVGPLIRTIAPEVSMVYFQPHWRRGPHVRVPVLATPQSFRNVVEPAVHDIVGGYLRDCPSRTVLDENAALAEHRRLAEYEQERGPLTPWASNNSVEFAEHDQRLHVLGSPAAATLMAGYYAATNDVVLDIIAWNRNGGSRMALAIDLFIATAHRFLPPVSYGFMSYRGHADAYLAKVPDVVRDRFDEVYLANADHFQQRVRTVTAAVDEHRPLPFGALIDVLARYRHSATELMERGELTLDGGQDEEVLPWGENWAAWSDRSEFHQVLGGHRGAADALGGWGPFRQFRVTLNWLYLNMYRIGINERERNLVCHIVSRAVEDVYGVRPLDRIRDLISYVDHGGRLES
jgi:hypothetical protein